MTRTNALKKAAEIEALGYILYGERVAVIRDEPEEVSPGGIIILKDSQRKPITGTIIMLGLAVKRDQFKHGEDSKYYDLAICDWLTFSKYDSTVHALYMKDGKQLDVEVMHGADVYIGSKKFATGK